MDLIARNGEWEPVTVRFPKLLKLIDKLDSAAKENGRSRNTEIIARLQQSLEAEQGAPESAETK